MITIWRDAIAEGEIKAVVADERTMILPGVFLYRLTPRSACRKKCLGFECRRQMQGSKWNGWHRINYCQVGGGGLRMCLYPPRGKSCLGNLQFHHRQHEALMSFSIINQSHVEISVQDDTDY
jgi:hypothetical protein